MMMRATLSLTVLAVALYATTAPAQARAYGDEHCFTAVALESEAVDDVVYYEDVSPYEAAASAILTDDAASDEFAERVWEFRLSQHPWLHDHLWLGAASDPLARDANDAPRAYVYHGRVHWLDAWTMRANEHFKRRSLLATGSKYMYVKPIMRDLARERADRRAEQGRACNPHITYIGN